MYGENLENVIFMLPNGRAYSRRFVHQSARHNFVQSKTQKL